MFRVFFDPAFLTFVFSLFLSTLLIVTPKFLLTEQSFTQFRFFTNIANLIAPVLLLGIDHATVWVPRPELYWLLRRFQAVAVIIILVVFGLWWVGVGQLFFVAFGALIAVSHFSGNLFRKEKHFFEYFLITQLASKVVPLMLLLILVRWKAYSQVYLEVSTTLLTALLCLVFWLKLPGKSGPHPLHLQRLPRILAFGLGSLAYVFIAKLSYLIALQQSSLPEKVNMFDIASACAATVLVPVLLRARVVEITAGLNEKQFLQAFSSRKYAILSQQLVLFVVFGIALMLAVYLQLFAYPMGTLIAMYIVISGHCFVAGTVPNFPNLLSGHAPIRILMPIMLVIYGATSGFVLFVPETVDILVSSTLIVGLFVVGQTWHVLKIEKHSIKYLNFPGLTFGTFLIVLGFAIRA